MVASYMSPILSTKWRNLWHYYVALNITVRNDPPAFPYDWCNARAPLSVGSIWFVVIATMVGNFCQLPPSPLFCQLPPSPLYYGVISSVPPPLMGHSGGESIHFFGDFWFLSLSVPSGGCRRWFQALYYTTPVRHRQCHFEIFLTLALCIQINK